jgi:iron(III) transport system permease protein
MSMTAADETVALPDPPSKGSPSMRAPRSRLGAGTLLNLAMIVLVGYLVLVPLAILIYSSLKPTTTDLPFQVPGISLANFEAVFSSSRLVEVTLNTVIYCVGSLLVALVLSTSLAYLFERTDIPGRRFLHPLAMAPMPIPPTVGAISWALVANPANGPLALAVQDLFGLSIDIYSLPGMILVTGIFGMPSMYLMIAPAIARLNPELEEVATIAGAPLSRRLRLIVIPLIRPAVAASSIMMVVVALEGFAIPAILGLPDRIFVYSSLIQYSLQPPGGVPNYGQASAYGVLVMLLSLVMLLVYKRRVRDVNRFKVVVGKGYRQNVIALGRWRTPMFIAVAALLFLTVVLPVLALVWTSLSPFGRPMSWSGLSTLTLDPYRSVFSSPEMGEILVNTAQVVFVTATVTTALSVWLALAATRRMFWGSTVLFEATFLVFGIPSIVLGAAVLFLYLFVPIPIYGTVWIIVVGLTTRFLPRGSRMIQAGLLQLDDGLMEAARVSGASSFTVTRKIILPLLKPVLWNCWFWVFVHALGQLPITLLLTGSDNKTLVVLLWDTFTASVNYPQASALAVVLLATSMLAMWLVNRRGKVEQS